MFSLISVDLLAKIKQLRLSYCIRKTLRAFRRWRCIGILSIILFIYFIIGFIYSTQSHKWKVAKKVANEVNSVAKGLYSVGYHYL